MKRGTPPPPAHETKQIVDDAKTSQRIRDSEKEAMREELERVRRSLRGSETD